MAEMPTLTNPNDLSIVTGVAPAIHGVIGNYYVENHCGAIQLCNLLVWLDTPHDLSGDTATEKSYQRLPAATARTSRTASATPFCHGGPWPGSTQVACTASSLASDASAISGSSVNGAGRGPRSPVST